jgi:hypothetical protein
MWGHNSNYSYIRGCVNNDWNLGGLIDDGRGSDQMTYRRSGRHWRIPLDLEDLEDFVALVVDDRDGDLAGVGAEERQLSACW